MKEIPTMIYKCIKSKFISYIAFETDTGPRSVGQCCMTAKEAIRVYIYDKTSTIGGIKADSAPGIFWDEERYC